MPSARRKALRLILASFAAGALITVLLSGPVHVAETWVGLAGDAVLDIHASSIGVTDEHDYSVSVSRRPFGDRWRAVSLKGFWGQRARPRYSSLEAPPWFRPFTRPDGGIINNPDNQAATCAGWPFRAFRATEWAGPLETSGSTVYFETFRKGGWHIGDARRNLNPDVPLVIPYLPIWPGLLGDLAIWSGAAALVMTGLQLARSAHRRRKGRCGTCGYNRSGLEPSTPCPECGAAA